MDGCDTGVRRGMRVRRGARVGASQPGPAPRTPPGCLMTGPIRTLVLRSVSGTGGGPEKTILLGAARTDPNRFAVTVCYLRDARDTAFSVDAKAAALPIDYVEVVERHSFHPSIWFELRRLVQQRRIDII